MTALASAIAAYRQLLRGNARTASSDAAVADPTTDLLDRLVAQPASFEERRKEMVAAIAASWRESGARLAPVAVRRTLDAMLAVPREQFVDPAIVDLAYLPTALAIGEDQTISHPQAVATMTLAARLRPSDRVLEVGTGCGYQAAVIATVAARVVSIEIRPGLAATAGDRLRRLGYNNVEVHPGDGCLGQDDDAPFDAILVTAGAATPPAALLAQLRPGGRLLIPIGSSQDDEELVVFTRMRSADFRRCSLGPMRFVPLLGAGMRESPGRTAPVSLPYCFGVPITGRPAIR